MSTDPQSPKNPMNVRYSRVLSLTGAIALGASVTVGLGVFVLLGTTTEVARVGTPYGLLALAFLPVVLTFAERGLASPGGRGVFRLGGLGEPSWAIFAGDWLALGGYASLVAVLGWGVALFVNPLLQRLLAVTIDETLLALAVIILMTWISALGLHGSRRTRTRLVYLSVFVLVIVIGWGWFAPVAMARSSFVLPAPGNIVQATAMLAAMLWGLGLILDHRDQVRRPVRTLLPSLLGALLLGCGAGLLAALVYLRHPGLGFGIPVPSAAFPSSMIGPIEVFYYTAGLVICFVALNRALVTGQRHLGSMIGEGYIPVRMPSFNPLWILTIRPLFILVPLSILVLVLATTESLISVTALFFLLTAALVNGRGVLRSAAYRAAQRPLKLPFHPLLPALAAAVCLYFSFALPSIVWWVAIAWGVIGGLYYLIYARRGGISVRRREYVLAEEIPADQEKAYRVLVDVDNLAMALSLVRAGVKLAETRGGQVLVMQVLVQPEEMPTSTKRGLAQDSLKVIKEIVSSVATDRVPVESMVRLAPSRPAGILETVREEEIDLILMGWEMALVARESVLSEDINRVVRAATADVAILRGEWCEKMPQITVSTAGGPHAAKALKLGRQLAEVEDGQIEALYIVRGDLTPDKEAQARSRLKQALADTGTPQAIEQRLAPAKDIKSGILQETAGSDLLLIGASHQGITDQAVFDGIPVEVARARQGPTLLVKHFEGPGQFVLRRVWETIYEPFPTLTVSERLEVNQRIRQTALAGVDFYTLIILASVIAVIGLIQNSAAVIIGAMLVAPLMSPILAMAHSIVLGDGRLLTQASESTIKGVVLAVVLAIAVALIIPPQPLSVEILSRTRPNLLDLLVALASGAAAAYALSRKRLAAALPGVAIAAALVPPLAVVGFGLGYGLYSLAGGALLLFITNLTAIILSAAIVFLLLGFRPAQAERGQRLQRGMLVSLVVIFIIAIPLGYTTYNFQRQLERQRIVESILEDELTEERAEVENVTITPVGDGFLVSGTIFAYDDLTKEEVSQIQDSLSQAVRAPVKIRVRVVQASLVEMDITPLGQVP